MELAPDNRGQLWIRAEGMERSVAGFGSRGASLEKVDLSWVLEMSRISVAGIVLVKGPGWGWGVVYQLEGTAQAKAERYEIVSSVWE